MCGGVWLIDVERWLCDGLMDFLLMSRPHHQNTHKHEEPTWRMTLPAFFSLGMLLLALSSSIAAFQAPLPPPPWGSRRSVGSILHAAAPEESGQQPQQHHTRRRRQSFSEGVTLGNLSARLDLMGWDVLGEPEEEGFKMLGLTVPDVKMEDFRDMKVKIRWGFEGGLSCASGSGPSADRKRKRKQPPIMVEFETPYALCYPPGTRARGCQELITPASLEEAGANGAGGGAVGLPCTVAGGTCPFVTFSCARGHTWVAEPGTPACFYCPRCREQTKNVRGFTATGLDTLPLPTLRGRRRVLDPAARFRKAVAEHAGGRVLGAYAGAKAKTLLRCGKGHEWEARPENVLRGSWCPVCANEARSSARGFTLADMQALAEEAGGAGAKCLPGQDYQGTARPLMWACSGASGRVHEFARTPNYVRKGLAVGRAFCVECERVGKARRAGDGPPTKPEGEGRRRRARERQQD